MGINTSVNKFMRILTGYLVMEYEYYMPKIEFACTAKKACAITNANHDKR